jgi:ATP diphosphatase
MPALAYANSVQERAARIGFDWDDVKGVLDKVSEELKELDEAQSDAEKELELGDLLFSIVNVARWMGVDAEAALRQSNARFYDRFTTMERLSRERGISFAQIPLDEKEALWQEAKKITAVQTR